MSDAPAGHTGQIIGSLLVALCIVAVTVAVVSARLGPDADAEEDLREERLEEQEDARDDRLDALEDRRDD